MRVRVKPHAAFPEIYLVTLEDGAHRLATKNLTPCRSVYGERLIRIKHVEYRLWDAFRSKLAAAILNGIRNIPLRPGESVLYLGAASGTTASHISDIIGNDGKVFCVEFASRSLRELVSNVCAYRPNMLPILEDARLPQKYSMFISGKVDIIYCDVAQPEQARVVADNAEVFLKESGWILLTVKAQSIDVTKDPAIIYEDEVRVLKKRGFKVEEVVHLEPYDKAHAMILAQKQFSS